MNSYVQNKAGISGLYGGCPVNLCGYGHASTSGYGDITVSRDPAVEKVVRWAIVILTAVIVIGMVQSLGFMMPWETGSTIAADAGSIVFLSGNDVMVSIVDINGTDEISSISLYFESSGKEVVIPNVQPTIRSGEPIIIQDLANGYSGEENIILKAEFESGNTKVLSKTHLEFS